MPDQRFFPPAQPQRIADLAALTGADIPSGPAAAETLTGIAPLEEAGPGDLSFFEDRKHKSALAHSRAGACFLRPEDEALAPDGMVVLVTPAPQRAYARAAALFYPASQIEPAIDPSAHLGDGAILEEGVRIDPGVVIGPGAEIGAGTWIGAHTVIGPGVTIGKACRIGANCTISHAFIGDRVRIAPNAAIGQAGFGFAPGPEGHAPIPQLGRVILQDDVDIGAQTAIDRGAFGDTVIGEGTKVDNLVQIAHNCRIGRHCILAGQVGLSGSTLLEDFAILGGQVGSAGHLTVGTGAQVAAQSGLHRNVPPGEVHGGTPAKPIAQWRRETGILARMAKRRPGSS